MTNEVPRGPKGRRRYTMDYIADRSLFLAVMFARKMIRESTPAGIANTRAASYYHVAVSDVARHVGQVGGTSAQRKRRRQ